MKNEKTIVFIFIIGLMFQQSLVAQKAQVSIVIRALSKTGQTLTDTDGSQRFFATVGQPIIGYMNVVSTIDKDGTVRVSAATSNNQVSKDLAGDGNEQEPELSSSPTLPKAFSLGQNYPNPFNPTTTINFQIPENEELRAVPTALKVYDVRGRLVKTLIQENLSHGFSSVHWDGSDNDGRIIGSGIYFYRIRASEFLASRKMLVLK